MRPLACSIAIILAASVIARGQPAATMSVEAMMKERLALPAADVARFESGSTVVWPVPANADDEIAAVGAIRTKGDLRRILAWLRDIESFIRAAGTENVGAMANPATPADLLRIPLAGADATAERARLGEIVSSYQTRGDAAVKSAAQFHDMLRRSTQVWDLSHPFASYLETFPNGAPPGTESRFYWTRDKVLTLHHVTIQTLDAGRLLVADKQFYASQDIDAGLMIALGVPNADFTSFDLVVAVKARADAMRGVAGRLLRGRVEKEVREALAVYLEWIRGSAAL
jgi:hypothetical protein